MAGTTLADLDVALAAIADTPSAPTESVTTTTLTPADAEADVIASVPIAPEMFSRGPARDNLGSPESATGPP